MSGRGGGTVSGSVCGCSPAGVSLAETLSFLVGSATASDGAAVVSASAGAAVSAWGSAAGTSAAGTVASPTALVSSLAVHVGR